MIEAKLEYRFLDSPLLYGIDQLLELQTTQQFGQNLIDYSQFGIKGHNGEDYGCNSGVPVFAAHKGTIVRVQDNITQGYGIWLLGEEMEIEGIKMRPRTSYWHLKGFNVQVGDIVEPRHIIGYADTTGYSTGDHLHFGLKFLYPDNKDVFVGNGYDGYITPRPFYLNRWFPGTIAGTYKLNQPTMKLVLLGQEQYLRDKDGNDYHVYNVATLQGLFQAGIIPSLTPEPVDSITDIGKEFVILTRE